MSDERYLTGMLHRPRGKGGWLRHLGKVDHLYGPDKSYAWVRTLCGRTGRMYGVHAVLTELHGLAEAERRIECKTCFRAWERRTNETQS